MGRAVSSGRHPALPTILPVHFLFQRGSNLAMALAVTPHPGFHLLLDPFPRNHFEAVRRAVHMRGFGGAVVLAGIDTGVEQLARLDRARAGPLQIDFRVNTQRYALFLSCVKKTRVLAGFVDLFGCFRKLSDQVKWWPGGIE
jgi:hypothetical protein